MNAIELLKSDHAVVADLFKKVKATDESEHPALFEKIRAELEVHAHIEEAIFYPKLKAEGNKELVDITLEGIEEHHQIKLFLRELSSLAAESQKFEPKLTVLIEDVEHHVEEEEKEMFPMVEDQFNADTLDELGAAMEAEKKVFKQTQAAAVGK
jgi:iron-sulfur cluster repair protein YtfE (RIC family)